MEKKRFYRRAEGMTKSIFSFTLLMLSAGAMAQNKCVLPTRWSGAAMGAAVPLAEYPRPQLVRKEWRCLNGWGDYDTTGGFAGGGGKILVPFCPESCLSGIHRKQEVNMWYRRKLVVPDAWRG